MLGFNFILVYSCVEDDDLFARLRMCTAASKASVKQFYIY